MKRNWADYIVTLAVLVCSVVLLAALTYALTGWSPDKNAPTLEIDYSDVTGIRAHSEVRYAGAHAGAVKAVRHLKLEERAAAEGEKRKNSVCVTGVLRNDLPPLPSDVKAGLASDSMLSEKFIALSAGTPDAPRLANGALLQGTSSGSFDEVLTSIGPVLLTVDQTLRSLEPVVKKTSETLDTLKVGIADVMPKISSVTDSAKSAAKLCRYSAPARRQAHLRQRRPHQGRPRRSQNALVKLQRVQKTVDGFVTNTDRQLAARIQELAVVLQNLKVVTTQAKGITKTLGEKPSRIIWGSKRNDLPSEETILKNKKPVPVR